MLNAATFSNLLLILNTIHFANKTPPSSQVLHLLIIQFFTGYGPGSFRCPHCLTISILHSLHINSWSATFFIMIWFLIRYFLHYDFIEGYLQDCPRILRKTKQRKLPSMIQGWRSKIQTTSSRSFRYGSGCIHLWKSSAKTSEEASTQWATDSGASHHFCNDFSLFQKPIPISMTISLGDHSTVHAFHAGLVVLHTSSGLLYLDSVQVLEFHYQPSRQIACNSNCKSSWWFVVGMGMVSERQECGQGTPAEGFRDNK